MGRNRAQGSVTEQLEDIAQSFVMGMLDLAVANFMANPLGEMVPAPAERKRSPKSKSRAKVVKLAGGMEYLPPAGKKRSHQKKR